MKGGTTEEEAATLVRAGDEAPDFTVTMFDGSQVTLSELRGKVVLLNFWATWCPPCRKEMTRVGKDIIERFAGRDFVFLPVSRGEGRSAVGAFREKNGYDFPMGLDSTKAVFGLYASNYIPRNFLIDREGKVVLASVDYDDEEFDALLRRHRKNARKSNPIETYGYQDDSQRSLPPHAEGHRPPRGGAARTCAPAKRRPTRSTA